MFHRWNITTPTFCFIFQWFCEKNYYVNILTSLPYSGALKSSPGDVIYPFKIFSKAHFKFLTQLKSRKSPHGTHKLLPLPKNPPRRPLHPATRQGWARGGTKYRCKVNPDWCEREMDAWSAKWITAALQNNLSPYRFNVLCFQAPISSIMVEFMSVLYA